MIYLDNAATSWPKPKTVLEAMKNCILNVGANPGRGGHKMAIDAGRLIYDTREFLAKLLNIDNPLRIIFTLNATEAINLALKGLLKKGDHVITSSIEHNSVTRPLKKMEESGVEVTYVTCERDGSINPEDIKRAIKPNTCLIAVTHASNVTGTLLPVEEIGKIAKQNNLKFMVDCAQTIGYMPIDTKKMNIDLLAFPGHKGLYGPQGTGGLYIKEGIDLVPLKEGGTGSNSESDYQPEILPDRYESGTPNTVGIVGLGAGVKFIMEEGLDKIRCHEETLMKRLLQGLKEIPQIEIYGPCDINKQVPVISFNFKEQDSSEIGFILDRVFDIACRTGLHCAPWAHKTIGTFEQGTIRFSLSYFNTMDEINYTLDSLKKIAAELK